MAVLVALLRLLIFCQLTLAYATSGLFPRRATLFHGAACFDTMVPVNIEVHQALYNIPPFQSDRDATQFAQNFTDIGRNYTAEVFGGFGDEAAARAGFYTVAIDRLGIADSRLGVPVEIVQAPSEVAALLEVTQQLRNGTFPDLGLAFSKVIHVGHSFGALQSYLLSTLHPEATDGVVLTGWSLNNTWLPLTLANWNVKIAAQNQPFRLGDREAAMNGLSGRIAQAIYNSSQNYTSDTFFLDFLAGYNDTTPSLNYSTTYLTWSDFAANQYSFLHPGSFDLALGLWSEQHKQPVTPSEILTLGGYIPPTSPFTGPVLVFTGRQDMIYCGGDCLATGSTAPSICDEIGDAYPEASAFEAYIQPETGHGINFHYNATEGFEVIFEWLKKNVLVSGVNGGSARMNATSVHAR